MTLLRSLGSQARHSTQRLCQPNVSSLRTITPIGKSYSTEGETTIQKSERAPPAKAVTWSANQRPKSQAMTGPRFEQTNLDAQPNPLPAIELIKKEPIRMVSSRVAACDGGGGALGHPKIFINLDKPGPQPCGYCGLRFERSHDDHH
ncbi:hypothetical protein PGTUg99_035993 [Puccinia graminis f. sp. tritici]|uniref:Zinc finger CHCC-type domain-containing protein n=1 Tax=Puccinia graminis f. sp. tritici TaxID=56615 RepID=A0A5B0SQZ1_PUCGR|nr:hypothetical protein PGTUg99_035993 [Puccinia graminis f. sp. tritici]